MRLPYHTPAQGTESCGSVGRPGPPVSSFVLDPFGCPVEIPPYNSQKSLATLANIQTNDDSADFGSLSDLCGHFCAWIRSNFLASRAWLGVGFFFCLVPYLNLCDQACESYLQLCCRYPLEASSGAVNTVCTGQAGIGGPRR